jgi:competence protein ComEA
MPFALSRTTALVAVGVSLAALVLVGQRLAQAGASRAPEPVAVPLEPLAETRPRRPMLVVHVVGSVRRPGLYRLREGSRIADAVRRAGGAVGGADLAAVNLAAPLVDGVQILVPASAGPGAAAASGASTAGSGGGAGAAGMLSLSSATLDELDELPGVGPVTAQKIVDYRTEHGPFASVDDLDAVPGIGPTRIEQLRELVTP